MSFNDEWADPPADQSEVLRSLPHAMGPEKSVLSSILQEPLQFLPLAIEEKLTQEHFYLPQNATLYAFFVELFEKNEEIEFVGLIQKLIDRNLLDRIGGPAGLTDIYTYSPSGTHFRHHLQMVKDKHILRAIIQNANEAIAMAYEAPEDPLAVLDTVEAQTMAIRDAGTEQKPQGNGPVINAVLQSLQERAEGKTASQGLMTGFQDLDRLTDGLQPGQMAVVAARPSMGKTSFLMNVAEHICIDQGRPSLIFSMEMTHFQVMQRLIFSRAKFVDRINRGVTPTIGDLQRIKRATLEIDKAPLHIDDRPGLSINELRAKARRMHRQHNIEFIGIDYLQLMHAKGKQSEASREREVATISAGVKGLAKELGIPIMILAQLNRGPETRTGKARGVPRVSDLRESGSLEQDADLVGLLYRPEQYADSDEEKEALRGIARLELPKNRDGATGSIPLTFYGELFRFETGEHPKEGELPLNQSTKSRHDRD